MPYGENPVNLTNGVEPGSANSEVASCTRAMIRREIRSVSPPPFAVNRTLTSPSLPGVSRSSEVVLSTELGITISLPLRSRTTVCRQVMSLTTPVVPETVTRSPGWITLPSMRPKPPITFAIVSFRPSDTAMPPTPSAVISVVGSMPNTGLSTIATATTQTSTRMMLMKIEALGILVLSSTRRSRPLSALVISAAATSVIVRKMILPAFAPNHCSIASISAVSLLIGSGVGLVRSHPTQRLVRGGPVRAGNSPG